MKNKQKTKGENIIIDKKRILVNNNHQKIENQVYFIEKKYYLK